MTLKRLLLAIYNSYHNHFFCDYSFKDITPSPSLRDLFSRDILDGFLSRALNIQLENNRLVAIDDSAYVLTLDYTIKMLNIHERYECGVPVIIEGETGVGKTALIEMLSKLWNQSLLLEWNKHRDRVVELFVRKMEEMSDSDCVPDSYEVGTIAQTRCCNQLGTACMYLAQIHDKMLLLTLLIDRNYIPNHKDTALTLY